MIKIKSIFFRCTYFCVFCLLSFSYFAQTKSTTIKTLNGKKYYIHKVEKGQSLYAIAKIYNMDVNSILAENDEAIEGLKNGQELKIPLESLVSKATLAIDTNKYMYHKIKKGETIYSISKKYNTNDKKLNAFNPSIVSGIKEDDYLVICEKQKTKIETLPQVFSPTTYTVLQGETLYSISRKLKITTVELIKLNPELKVGLKQGQVLKLNSKKRDDDFLVICEKQKPKIETLNLKDIGETDTLLFSKPKKAIYNVGLFLPFKLNESELINIEDLLRTKSSFPAAQTIALDFYFGFKKAIDSLVEKDFDVSITLFDVQEKDSAKVEAICKTSEFKKLDVIFGPLYAEVFKKVSNRAKALQIPCISPITQQSKILYNNTLVSKVNPSQYTLIESLADYCLDSLMQNSKVIIVNSTQKDQPYVKAFKKRYNDNLMSRGKTLKDSIIEVRGLAGVKGSFISDKKNIVILLTNNQVYIQDFVTQLAVFSNKKDIELLGFENTTKIDNLDQGYLNDLNFHFASANYIDYSFPLTKELVKQYQEVYFSDPSGYYFEGFDIATYYLSNLKKQGPSIFLNLDKIKYTGVSCGFKFWRLDSSSGFENRAISIYKYSNCKLQKLGWN